jgi:hypothetical protein
MPKSATDIMQEIIFSAVIDAVMALKDASKGLPNALVRDIGTIHANTAFADLPEPIQATVSESVRRAFAQLRKEGYAVADARSVAPSDPRPPVGRPPRGDGGRPSSDHRRPPGPPRDKGRPGGR